MGAQPARSPAAAVHGGLEFAVLGPLEIRRDGELLPLPPPRAQAVLAVLVLHANTVVSADRLCEELWPSGWPDSARAALQVHVAAVRRALGSAVALTTRAPGYLLELENDQIDAWRFEQATRRGRAALAAGDAQQARTELEGALGLWRGHALPDLADIPCVQSESARLEEQRLAALEDRIDADLMLGTHGELIGELAQLASQHPYRERLHGQHMLALYRAGRHADALAAYRQARAVLDTELGLEPGPELRRLEQAILTHDPGLAPSAARKPAVPPAPVTRTFGRDEDVRRVVSLLGETRCLTLVGAGGVGKTRLAIEVARTVGGGFVSLASTVHAESLPAVICDALAVTRAPGEPATEALDRAVGRVPHLLVLDNLEHLLPDVSALVAGLLDRHPGLRLLATSRWPLRIRAERLFHVEPLALEGDHSPAVAMFVDRARAHDPSFEITPEVAAAATTICTRLSGLPLAIELAAARLAVLTPEALAERLDDALGVLGPGHQDAPTRQQTLRATLDWSFELLDERERDAYAALGTFAGGCELDAAEAVTGAELPVLERLVTQNLVVARGGRLTMLEPVRQYAVERLAGRPDADMLRARHLNHYLGLAERSEQPVWLYRRSCREYAALRREHDNFRAAVEWGARHGPTPAVLKLVSALGWYAWLAGAAAELRDWWERASANAGSEPPPAVRAWAELARAITAADPSDRVQIMRGALALFRGVGDVRMTARCLIDLAGYETFQGDHAGGRGTAERALSVARRLGDDVLIGAALGEMALGTVDIEAAMPLAREAADRLRRAGAVVRCAELLSTLGMLALHTRAYDRAEQLEREALDDARTIGDPWTVAFVHGNTGLAAFAGGRRDTAETAFRNELTAAHAHGFQTLYFEGLLGLGALAAADGDDERAATLDGAAWALNDRPVAPSETPIYAPLHAELSRARHRLGERAWNAAKAQGSTMTADVAITFALDADAVRARF